jgi:4-hydroxy-L-threonine phosphate dehydrogenase PdxA
MSKPAIAITMGDAAGIGPELIVKVLSDPTVYDRCKPCAASRRSSPMHATPECA